MLGCGQQQERPAEAAAPAESPAEALVALAPSGQAYSEPREACASRHPLREAFWGELHVHTTLSMDANMWDVRGTPDDAYRFAKGEPVRLAPLDEAGEMTRPAQLERPLDFAAVTDHASFIGEVALCSRAGSPSYDSESCQIFRGERAAPESPLGEFGARMGAIASSIAPDAEVPRRSPELCGGEDTVRCIDMMRTVWEEIGAAAERHYDRSAECRFTTFHAYEYTATPAGTKVHHNVVFRNQHVPAAPIAWVDEPDVYGLWQKLREQCLDAGSGCDVLTIPHNSNLSNGRMFVVPGKDLPLDEQRERASLRARLEPLVEISQIKGDSECRNGMFQVLGGRDEFCDYEKWRPANTPDCEEGTGSGALFGGGCISRLDFVRYVLVEGLREDRRLGINPYKLGIIAATDAHNANPGDAEEYSYQGWMGESDSTLEARLSGASEKFPLSNAAASPGGLAAVWAEENSRDALFDAMQRRETFGTSGPRMTARFFGGWDYPEDLCDDPDLVGKGYAGGVPMGGDLGPRPDGAAPTFVVSALRDPGAPEHPGGLLQRAQVIKGWLDAEGRFHQAVYDVAGGANGASVDLDTCTPQGSGAEALCSVWRDPDFDPTRRAVYYARVLENPSCRWNQQQCVALSADERPEACSNPELPRTLQERLWTSPIWYDAQGAS
jgi:hypothetical protein